jgi:ADP-ribose pyrophosphatase YjhB (NUDIX family)
MTPKWLLWAGRLQAIAQSGLAYATNPFEIDRYNQIRDVSFEIMASHSDADVESVRAIFEGERGYATPKVDVRGFVLSEGNVLLIRERADGLWSLPGGWADVNDSPSEAVVREVREESGHLTKAVKLLALYDRNRHGHTPFPFHIYKLFFLCAPLDGVPGARPPKGAAPNGSSSVSHETLEVGFFPLDRLPPLSTGRVTEAQIRRLAALAGDPASPTDFD